MFDWKFLSDKIDDLASNEMLHDITIRGLQHLSLNGGDTSLPLVVENLCSMRRKHQRLFNKLQQLREESARLQGWALGLAFLE